MTEHLAAVGLGSNLGDRAMHLRAAVAALSELGRLLAVSSLYETEPLGVPDDQDPFLNAVALVVTELSPSEFLDEMLKVERAAGRVRDVPLAARTLDLDLLLYGDAEIDLADLTVPHPRMTQRRFVLEPLLEVLPEATLPDGKPLEGFREAVADQHVRMLPDKVWIEAELPPAEPPRRRGVTVVPRGCAQRVAGVVVLAVVVTVVVGPNIQRARSH